MRSRATVGFTIVELLVVIAIIAMIVALLLPAVQAVREAARRTQCGNKLRQMGIAIVAHEQAHGHFPTGGWGNQWVGDPDGGFGAKQSGGWIYNILPYLELKPLREFGKRAPEREKRGALTRLLATDVNYFTCPSRRSSARGAYTATPLRNADIPPQVFKTDYAINGGSIVLSGGGGPESSSRKDVRSYKWPDTKDFNGVSFVRSRVRSAHIVDGLHKTYLVGEKLKYQESDPNYGDDQSLFVGDDADVRRWTFHAPEPDRVSGEIVHVDKFGSAHSGGCHFAFCDGSVRLVEFDVVLAVHRASGNRRDRYENYGAGSRN